MTTMDEDYYAEDYDPVYDRLDEIMYGGEPDEPNCFDCWDGTRVRRRDGHCPTCSPSPRHVRRARHHEWQFNDRMNRLADQQAEYIRKAFPALRDGEAPF